MANVLSTMLLLWPPNVSVLISILCNTSSYIPIKLTYCDSAYCLIIPGCPCRNIAIVHASCMSNQVWSETKWNIDSKPLHNLLGLQIKYNFRNQEFALDKAVTMVQLKAYGAIPVSHQKWVHFLSVSGWPASTLHQLLLMPHHVL